MNIAIVDAVNMTVYTNGHALDLRMPAGWRRINPANLPGLKAALALRACGFMTADRKIDGIKLIRSVVDGLGLKDAKDVWEHVNAMPDSTATGLYTIASS